MYMHMNMHEHTGPLQPRRADGGDQRDGCNMEKAGNNDKRFHPNYPAGTQPLISTEQAKLLIRNAFSVIGLLEKGEELPWLSHVLLPQVLGKSPVVGSACLATHITTAGGSAGASRNREAEGPSLRPQRL